MRINNPDIKQEDLVKNSIEKIIKNNQIDNKTIDGEYLFINFIRNYSNKLDKLKNDFLKKANIDKNNFYNLVLNLKDYKNISN